LIAEGLGTGDIADTQNLTRETVRTYVKRILEKTGTKNRAQLVRLALTGKVPFAFKDLGEQALKNIPEPVHPGAARRVGLHAGARGGLAQGRAGPSLGVGCHTERRSV
jgi:hypothetical protein